MASGPGNVGGPGKTGGSSPTPPKGPNPGLEAVEDTSKRVDEFVNNPTTDRPHVAPELDRNNPQGAGACRRPGSPPLTPEQLKANSENPHNIAAEVIEQLGKITTRD